MTNCKGCKNESKLCLARDHYVCMVANMTVSLDKETETRCRSCMNMKDTVMWNGI